MQNDTKMQENDAKMNHFGVILAGFWHHFDDILGACFHPKSCKCRIQVAGFDKVVQNEVLEYPYFCLFLDCFFCDNDDILEQFGMLFDAFLFHFCMFF